MSQVLDLGNGWKFRYDGPGDWDITNPDEQSGKKRFFLIKMGQYCPLMYEEPELAMQLTGNFVDLNGCTVQPQPLKGVICKDASGENGKILYRGNLTNALGKDQGKISDDGSLFTHQGVDYKLYGLIAENKNRIVGAIGFYLPADKHSGGPVICKEIENLG